MTTGLRTVIGGNGQDNTTAAAAYLAANKIFLLRDLYIIGEPEDPQSLWLTDHEAPVIYSPWNGVFQPAVISRGQVTCKIGLDAQTLMVNWSPPAAQSFTTNTATASPYQLARLHCYDNWPVRIFRCIMPTPGDANTIGAMEWFGGRIDTCAPERGKIQFSVASYTSVLTQKVPSTVVEVTNTLASSGAATVPPGDPSIPVFQVYTGSTETTIFGDCLRPTAGKIYSGNLFVGGYLVFVAAAGATLAGVWSAIGANGAMKDGSGNSHSSFTIYAPLPWPPSTTDQFYVSMAPPINLADAGSRGFPYVPNPTAAA